MKLMIMGHSRHGKDTVADLLNEHTGLIYASSSSYACDLFIFNELKDRFGYKNEALCWLDRNRDDAMRALWARLIREYNKDDPTRLGTAILTDFDMYIGIRSYEECVALKEKGLYDIAVWVDASKRLPLQDSASMDSRLIELADYVIDNNGSECQLKEQVLKFCDFLKGVK